ncbi:RNA-directed DNA polymerase from mobile element jockey-like [Rhizophagus irregularis DAOM 181602=DAOM 197198]|nr:RNA-directed DNA polymerase from mobile element jockey-like [Rhizophagus irregularis DAOM 181602=DAOM 197198]
MDRIKIPNDFSSLILELFKDRKNQVITAYGKTAPYDVLTGINQGEVISPLLWYIYYDPLLAEIDQQQLGYNISCISKSVVQEEGVFNQQHVSVMAYMDDTQWITDEKSKLEKLLYIADTFYRLNDIQINKEKSELMMRTTTEKRRYSHNYNDKILIKFGREEINIKAKHPHKPMCILEVYFNIKHDGNYLMFKIKNEIDHLVNLMYKKKITDKHILYIFNRIIVPRVEYWSQVMALSKTQTEALIIPFRRMFKNKLKFARSAPNAILDNPYIYGYRDFYDNQLQSKITDFCIQLNDNGLLGKVTEIHLKSLQDQLWTSRPLIEKLPYNRVPHTRKNNYILNMLLLCYDNNISLENLDINTFPTIKGGQIPLEDVVDNAYYSKHRKRLREKNILFLDQIISGDKSRLLLWKEILIKAYIPVFSQRKETKWYSDIRNLITSDGVHLNHNITQLFSARVDNVEEPRSYNITKKIDL